MKRIYCLMLSLLFTSLNAYSANHVIFNFDINSTQLQPPVIISFVYESLGNFHPGTVIYDSLQNSNSLVFDTYVYSNTINVTEAMVKHGWSTYFDKYSIDESCKNIDVSMTPGTTWIKLRIDTGYQRVLFCNA